MNKSQLALIGAMLCLSSCQNECFKDINHEILPSKTAESQLEFVDPETDWDITVGVTTKDQVISKLKSKNLQYELLTEQNQKTSESENVSAMIVQMPEQLPIVFLFEQDLLHSVSTLFGESIAISI